MTTTEKTILITVLKALKGITKKIQELIDSEVVSGNR
jgi:hypothetical protein